MSIHFRYQSNWDKVDAIKKLQTLFESLPIGVIPISNIFSLSFPPRCISAKAAAKMIKDTMDKKFGPAWHVVVGMGFGFEITHEVKNLLYMFFGGNTAICLWKCA